MAQERFQIPVESVVAHSFVPVPKEYPAPFRALAAHYGLDAIPEIAACVQVDGRTFHIIEHAWSCDPAVWEADALDMDTGDVVRLVGWTLSGPQKALGDGWDEFFDRFQKGA